MINKSKSNKIYKLFYHEIFTFCRPDLGQKYFADQVVILHILRSYRKFNNSYKSKTLQAHVSHYIAESNRFWSWSRHLRRSYDVINVGKMSQFYDFGIYYTWQATQSFTGKLHLTKCTLFKVIQRFVIILRFCRRIRHIYDVRMAAKWRKLAIFASFCTLQVTNQLRLCLFTLNQFCMNLYNMWWWLKLFPLFMT